jgi:phosphoribosylformimino-5-aminoimidazole carboxamide ribotide isomerase
MIIYPALDLREGKVVRLQQGDPSRQTVYGDDPVAIAEKWIGAGAEWLHVVNLDGAFAEASQNEPIIGRLCERARLRGVNVQCGGGLRSAADIARAFERGISRVVLGTIAVQQPEKVQEWVAQYGAERIAVALDARDGFVATHGWQQLSTQTPIDLGKRLASFGVRHALYTDVNRDGELSGVNVASTAALATATGLAVIASGGVSSLTDLIALKQTGKVAGVVLGKALYEGRLTVEQSLAAMR